MGCRRMSHGVAKRSRGVSKRSRAVPEDVTWSFGRCHMGLQRGPMDPRRMSHGPAKRYDGVSEDVAWCVIALEPFRGTRT
jgi:hypothetical protein